ncbi:hypothetical protein GOV08_04085, partial [Candidatus Woesearchaeota archaeon]|nr:hypothetical protein [Candidatus Woesearchaeota archaeon]
MFFKKKLTPDQAIADTVQAANEIVPEETKKDEGLNTGNQKLDIELTKIKAQLDGFGEIRKANSERFQRLSEQIGEIRGMIMDSNKAVGEIEVKATKASDLVTSVQPEKLMIDVKKVEGKVDALRANIESNEAMMKNIMEELKIMRNQVKFYKGIDQVTKLSEEVKKELMEIKKVVASAKRHADKVDTIFIEVNKKFTEFDKFNDVVKDIDRSFKSIQTDFDKMKVNIDNKEDKKEFVQLLNKFNDFEKHTTNIIDLLGKKSKTIKSDIDNRFEAVRGKLERKFDVDLKQESSGQQTSEEGSEPAKEAQSSESASENKPEPKEETPVEENPAQEKPKEEAPKEVLQQSSPSPTTPATQPTQQAARVTPQ